MSMGIEVRPWHFRQRVNFVPGSFGEQLRVVKR